MFDLGGPQDTSALSSGTPPSPRALSTQSGRQTGLAPQGGQHLLGGPACRLEEPTAWHAGSPRELHSRSQLKTAELALWQKDSGPQFPAKIFAIAIISSAATGRFFNKPERTRGSGGASQNNQPKASRCFWDPTVPLFTSSCGLQARGGLVTWQLT